jgi:hypothetical protein
VNAAKDRLNLLNGQPIGGLPSIVIDDMDEKKGEHKGSDGVDEKKLPPLTVISHPKSHLASMRFI